MKFIVASVVAALAATVSALPAFTNTAFDIVAGQPFTLTWSGNSGPVTISLANGDPNNLKVVETIDCT